MAMCCYCFAQEDLVDSTYIFEADPIIVTAERYESLKLNSTSAISVINENEITLLPINRLTDAIGTAPGMVFMHQDGLGEDPILNVRVDGRPLNNLESDLVNWNAIPITDIQSMEVLKGQSSSLYGNMAVGGVLNIRTKQQEKNVTKVGLWGGSFNNYKVQLSFNAKAFKIYGSMNELDGYRDHAHRQNYTIGGSVQLVKNQAHLLKLSLINYWTNYEIPGPLPRPELELNRS